jgi:hypothetical protein
MIASLRILLGMRNVLDKFVEKIKILPTPVFTDLCPVEPYSTPNDCASNKIQ